MSVHLPQLARVHSFPRHISLQYARPELAGAVLHSWAEKRITDPFRVM